LDANLNVSGSVAFTISQTTMTTTASSLVVTNASVFGGNVDISLNTISNIGGKCGDYLTFTGSVPVFDTFTYGNRYYYKIATNATFVPVSNISAEIFMIGGGGGGGTTTAGPSYGGGGSAGRLFTNYSLITSGATPNFTLPTSPAPGSITINTIYTSNTYTVTVGASGAAGGAGGSTVLSFPSTTFTATGGSTLVAGAGGGGVAGANFTSNGGAGVAYAGAGYGGGGAALGGSPATSGTVGYGGGAAGNVTGARIDPGTGANGTGAGGGGGGSNSSLNLTGGVGGTGVFIISFFTSNISSDIHFSGSSNNTLKSYPTSLSITAASNVVVNANILPGSNNLYTLGSRYQRWLNVYARNVIIAKTTMRFDPESNDSFIDFSALGEVITATQGSSYISAMPGVSVNSNSIFAVGDDTAYPLRLSTEGSLWANVTENIQVNPIYDIAYDGRAVWVLAGQMSNNPNSGGFASGDSIKWNNIPTAGNAYHTPGPTNAVCFCGRDARWYAVGVDACGANTILRSARQDEQKWSNAVSSNSAFFWSGVGRSVAWDGNATVVACGDSSASNSAILWADVTSNGTVWYNATYLSDLSTQIDMSGQCVSYNGVEWLCAGGNAGLLRSVNGRAWSNVLSLSDFTAQCAEWNGQTWLVGGVDGLAGAGLYYSSNATVWVSVSDSIGWNVRSVAWNGTQWAATNGNTILKSQSAGGPWLSTAGSNIFSGNVNNLANTALLPNAAFVPGQRMLTGTGEPSLQLGNVGDLYTNTANRYIYGPKKQFVSMAGVTLSWGAPTIPVAVPQRFEGYGVPETDPSGSRPGDTYIDLSTGAVYRIY